MRLKRAAFGATAILTVLLGAGWWYHGVQAESLPPVETVAVRLGDLEKTVTALGKLEPLQFVDVGAQISGQIDRIHAQPGDRVNAGDLLTEIDSTVYEAQVAADRATVVGLEAQLVERKAMLRLAEQRQKRNAGLFAANATSKESLDSSVAEAEAAKARVAVLEAEIGKARSTLDANVANLGYTRIMAPMAGTVMSLAVRQGQAISARQQAPVILQIANLDTMTVKTQVSEADVGKLRVGMEAYFTTLGDPGRRWSGKLRQILPTPEVINDVVLYHALFDVENADRRLMPQMTAQVFFLIGRAEGVPLVPMAALRPTGKPDRYRVQIADGETVTTRTITVGLQDRVHAVVLDGLVPGEEVVVGGGAGRVAGGNGRRRPAGA